MKKRTLLTLAVIEENGNTYAAVEPLSGMTYLECNYTCLFAMDALGIMASRLLDKDGNVSELQTLTVSNSKAN